MKEVSNGLCLCNGLEVIHMIQTNVETQNFAISYEYSWRHKEGKVVLCLIS
jgi:hypothetical protein